ncbi:MAG TPA: VPLPA-CTERM sorting domain-containing protein [Sedimentisphaerales bacterium]
MPTPASFTAGSVTGIKLTSNPDNFFDPNYSSFIQFGDCDHHCSAETFTFNNVTTGGGTLGTTPLPAALPLFATGLGVMGLVARRRKRKSAATAA